MHVTHGENLNILPCKLIKTTPERHKESVLTFHGKTEQAILVDDLQRTGFTLSRKRKEIKSKLSIIPLVL